MSLQVASVLITFGAYVTGIFGMNLDNTVTIQPIYGVFTLVSVLTFALIIVGNFVVMYYYERTGVIPATIRIHNHLVGDFLIRIFLMPHRIYPLTNLPL